VPDRASEQDAFPRIAAVVGLGMVGGAFALRLRERGARVIGVDVDRAVVQAARERGAIDEGSTDLGAVAGADFVIVSTSLEHVARVAVETSKRMRPGALLTDVGSVKAGIVAAVTAALPAGVRFVGGHPMAGNERQGIAAADAALLDGRVFVLTPTAKTPAATVEALEAIIVRLGMRPMVLDPAQHDELVAQVSHLPYLLSVALSRSIADDARAIGGPTMVEMTRVARSPKAMWTEICRMNRAAILRALDQFEHELGRVRRSLEEGAMAL
jgi:prephenate dehydrogenase